MATKGIKIPTFVNEQPLSAAVASKLNKPYSRTVQYKESALLTDAPSVALYNHTKIKNNEDILKLFSDVELGIQILVSSIISPNDMLTSNSVYIPPEPNKCKVPLTMRTSITNCIKQHVEKYYKLDENLYRDLREALCTKGACVYAIIPEASLDDIINPDFNGQISIENFKHTLTSERFLNPTSSFNCSIESIDGRRVLSPVLKNATTVTVTEESLGFRIIDNPTILNINNSRRKRLDRNVKRSIPGYLSTEDYQNKVKKDEEVEVDLNRIFKDTSRLPYDPYRRVNTIDSASRESIGRPMVIKLPPESIVPIYSTNDETRHLGYFVMLNEQGSPITLDDVENEENCANNGSNLILTKSQQAIYGATVDDAKMNNMEELYGLLVERMIKEKLKNSQYEELAYLKDTADIYRVMFYRSLKQQKTNILFIPEPCISYYAFQYRKNGSGKSLLEDNAILFSLRAILLFSKLMATVRNSTPMTKVSVTLDDELTDPMKLRDMIMSEALKNRQMSLPLGIMRLDDLTEWLHKSGFIFDIKHPALPNIDLSYENVTADHSIPDESLDEELRKMLYMSLGLTPEIVDSAYNSDFATTITAKNLLFSKSIARYQKQLNAIRTDHLRKLIKSDVHLQNKIKAIVENDLNEAFKYAKKVDIVDENGEEVNATIKKKDLPDYVLQCFADEISIELPGITLIDADTLRNAQQAYSDSVSQTLDMIFEGLSGTEGFGELGNKLETIKSYLKSNLIMKWCSDNNFLPEITESMSVGEDGKPLYDIYQDFETLFSIVSDNYMKFAKRHNKNVKKVNDKLQKIEEAASGSSSGSSDYSSDDNDNDSSDSSYGDSDSDSGDTDDGSDNFDIDMGDGEGNTDDDNKVDSNDKDEDEVKDDKKEDDEKKNKEEKEEDDGLPTESADQ